MPKGDNLRNIPHDVRIRNSSKGGKAPRDTTRMKENRTFKKAVEFALNMPAFRAQNYVVDKMLERYPDMNNYEAMAIAVAAKAVKDGDPKAFIAIRDTAGESPNNLVQATPMTITIKMLDPNDEEED